MFRYYVIYEDKNGKASSFVTFPGGIQTEADVVKLTEQVGAVNGSEVLILDWKRLQ